MASHENISQDQENLDQSDAERHLQEFGEGFSYFQSARPYLTQFKSANITYNAYHYRHLNLNFQHDHRTSKFHQKLTRFIWFTDLYVKELVPSNKHGYRFAHTVRVDPSRVTSKLKYLSKLFAVSRITNKHINFIHLIANFHEAYAGDQMRTIVTEFAYKNLSRYNICARFLSKSILHPNIIHEIFRELLDTLNFLHENGLTHGSLTPECIVCKCAKSLVPIAIVDIDQYEHGFINTDNYSHAPTKSLARSNLSHFLPPEMIIKAVFEDKAGLASIEKKLIASPGLLERFTELFSPGELQRWLEYNRRGSEFERRKRMDIFQLASTMFNLITQRLPFLSWSWDNGITPDAIEVTDQLHVKHHQFDYCMSNCVGCLLNQFLTQRNCAEGLSSLWPLKASSSFLFFGSHHAVLISLGLHFNPENRPKIKDFLSAYEELTSMNEGLRFLKHQCVVPPILPGEDPRFDQPNDERLKLEEQYFALVAVNDRNNALLFQSAWCQTVPSNRFLEMPNFFTQTKRFIYDRQSVSAINQLLEWRQASIARPVQIQDYLVCASWNGKSLGVYMFNPFNIPGHRVDGNQAAQFQNQQCLPTTDPTLRSTTPAVIDPPQPVLPLQGAQTLLMQRSKLLVPAIVLIPDLHSSINQSSFENPPLLSA